MIKDRFKEEIAEITARSFAELLSAGGEEEVPDDFSRDDFKWQIYDRLEIPRNPDMGHYALPLFQYAKQAGINPVEINKLLAASQMRLVKKYKEYGHLEFLAVGGFNNARIKTAALARETLGRIRDQDKKYGSAEIGGGRAVVIDFSSPNIAKPFGIGHLRSTAIGNALYRMYHKLGFKPVGINHLGDWGTQFGKLIVAFRKWGSEEELKKDPIQKLYDIYVRFHQEEENDPALSEQAREAFRALEDGDEEVTSLWNKFKDYSIAAFEKTYKLLGVHFDHYTGESFYNDKMEPAIARLEAAGLTEVSQGALTVNLDKYDLPPCLLRKADGATLYATRDIAGILYRAETYAFDRALYVVGTAQSVHFKQVFKVIALLEEAEKVPEDRRIENRLRHVEFGWIKFKDEMMSTRKGNIILLEEVLDKAIKLARARIAEKNPDLKAIGKTARMIGVGAVIFADLSSRRQKDVNFDWDEILNFEGETGPYLQYTHARLSSLLRNYGRKIPARISHGLLDNPEEARVIDLLYRFPQIVFEAAESCEPFVISSYLIELAAAFNKVYQRKDDQGRMDKIISDDEKLTAARMVLVAGVRTVIKEGLYLLGIEAPEEM